MRPGSRPFPVGLSWKDRAIMWLYTLNTRVLGSALGLYWRLGLEGEVESIPTDGPILVTANHSSFLDPWFISMPFPRPVRYLMTEKWYYRSRFWEAFFKAYGTIPMRERDPRSTIETVCRHLERGEVLGVFPEGKISSDGRMQKFRSGVARIAALTGVPVLPLGIRGAHGSLPRTKRVPRPTRVRVHVGKPRTFPGAPMAGPPDSASIREFNEGLYESVRKLAGQPPAKNPPVAGSATASVEYERTASATRSS